MEGRIIEIRDNYLAKWPMLKVFIDERPGLICLAYQIEEEVEAVMLVGGGRIYHIHVKEESRHGGYGRELVDYAVRNYSDPKDGMATVVEPTNDAAVVMFIKCGFRINGFEVTWGDNRYLMTHNKSWTFKGDDKLLPIKNDLEDLAEHLYVVEALPFRITQ